MRTNRDSLEMFTDFLRVASSCESKTEIMISANLNIYYMKRYLANALSKGFVTIDGSGYSVTKKGESFLRESLDLKSRLTKARELLEECKKEKQRLEGYCFLREDQKLDKEISPTQEIGIPSLISSFKRIDTSEYYKELLVLGFSVEASCEVISWVDLIYRKSKTFFAGKRVDTIKGCLACNGAVAFRASGVTRRKIGAFFNVRQETLQRSCLDCRRLIEQEKPELFRKENL